MPQHNAADNFGTTLASAATSSQTTLNLSTLTGAPTAYPYYLALTSAGSTFPFSKYEIVNVTSLVSGTTVNVIRGVGVTTAQAWNSGDNVSNNLTSMDFASLLQPNWPADLKAAGFPLTAKAYGASGSDQFTTVTTTAGSASVTLASAIDFSNGQGISILGAGAATALATPSAAPTVTPIGTAGTTSYSYTIAYIDSLGGVTAASAVGSTATGNATLSATNYNTVSWAAAPTGTAGIALYRTEAAGSSPTTTGLIDVLPSTSTSRNDIGLNVIAGPAGVPVASPSTATAQILVTTILSGAGTTSLTLAASATTEVSGASCYHDDTASLQSMIVAAKGNNVQECLIPGGVYRITSPLVIDDTFTMRGIGAFELGSGPNLDLPATSPFLAGSIIAPLTPCIDAIQITSSGQVVNLRDLGVRWDYPFCGTGHAFNAGAQSSQASGLFMSQWSGLKVWGHDGYHYAFYFINPIQNTTTHLRSYGGGNTYMASNSEGGYYGNHVAIHHSGEMICGGTAHGFDLTNDTTGIGLNLFVFIRPQINLDNVSPTLGITMNPPEDTQYTCNIPTDKTYTYSLLAPDFESTVGGGLNVYAQKNLGTIAHFTDQLGGKGAGTEIGANPSYGLSWTQGNGAIVQTVGGQSFTLADVAGGTVIPQVILSGTGITLSGMEELSTLNGTSAGTATYGQPFSGNSYKKWFAYLNGYENTTTTAQTLSFSSAFDYPPAVVAAPSGFTVTTTTSGVSFPSSMTAAVTGWVIVEGF